MKAALERKGSNYQTRGGDRGGDLLKKFNPVTTGGESVGVEGMVSFRGH